MKLTDDEIAKEIEYLRHAEENDAADMILALKARAEDAEKALAELEATLVQEDTAEIQFLKASMEDTRKDRADAWNQRNAIYAELTKAQARAEAAEKALQEIVENTSERSLASNIARAALEAKP